MQLFIVSVSLWIRSACKVLTGFTVLQDDQNQARTCEHLLFKMFQIYLNSDF